jgi:hypothetical protein
VQGEGSFRGRCVFLRAFLNHIDVQFPVLYLYLPPGTQAHIGPIASQGGAWLGGGLQVYVPNQQCERLRNGNI